MQWLLPSMGFGDKCFERRTFETKEAYQASMWKIKLDFILCRTLTTGDHLVSPVNKS